MITPRNDYFPVPPRIYYHGDETAGRTYTGLGKKRLKDLIHAMSFSDIQQAKNYLRLDDGTLIETQVNFGLPEIHITMPTGGKEEVEIKLKDVCFCGCHLATGIIRKVSRRLCCYDFLKGPVYDVDVCFGKSEYVLCEDVKSMDYSPYTNEQIVIVAWKGASSSDTYIDNPDGCAIIDDCVITSIPATGDAAEEFYKKTIV